MHKKTVFRPARALRCALVVLLVSLVAFNVYLPARGIAGPADAVTIPDPNLRAALNAALNPAQPATSPITEAQMASIVTLAPSATLEAKITDLTGLEYATNLVNLLFNGGSKVTDLTPIAGLTSLQALSFQRSPVTTLPDLSALTKVRTVDFQSLQLTSGEIEKLPRTPTLISINVSQNAKLTSLAPFADFPNLQNLNVQFCGIFDYSVLQTAHTAGGFPALTSFAGSLQNVGAEEIIEDSIKTEQMTFDPVAGTVFIPFSLFPDRFTHWNGVKPGYVSPPTNNNTYFVVNGTQKTPSQFLVGPSGITMTGYDNTTYHQIQTIRYNALMSNPASSYKNPPWLASYAASNGSYDVTLTVDNSVIITADASITYPANSPMSESTFLDDIHATTNDGSPVTSNFASVVDFAVPGTYTVRLDAHDIYGNEADPVFVSVNIQGPPKQIVITADPSITYPVHAVVREATFLADIHATTNDGSPVTSDFASVVKLDTPGTYTVTLMATDGDGTFAEPKTVTVTIFADPKPDPEPNPKPRPPAPSYDSSKTPAAPRSSTGGTPRNGSSNVPTGDEDGWLWAFAALAAVSGTALFALACTTKRSAAQS